MEEIMFKRVRIFKIDKSIIERGELNERVR